MIIHDAYDYKIGLGEKIEAPAVDGSWRLCYVQLNSLSFGYATNTIWEFWVYYKDINEWNFEKPSLPTYYYTPRAVLPKVILPVSQEFESAPPMRMGYSSALMQAYEDKSFPDGYFKVPWDYPCPHIEPNVKYVHPEENRVLTQLELEALFGSPLDDVPSRIKYYLEKHIHFYINRLWGEQDFEATYDKFLGNGKWRVVPAGGKFIKHYNFQQYTPMLVCMESDRYPTPSRG